MLPNFFLSFKPIEFPDNWQFSKPVPPTDLDDSTLLDTGVTQTPLSSSSPESVSPNVEPEIKSTTITDLLMFLAKIGVSVVVVGSLVTGGFLVKKLGVSTLSTMDLAEIDAGWDNGVGISNRFCDAMLETYNSKLTIVAPIGFIPSDSYRNSENKIKAITSCVLNSIFMNVLLRINL